MARAFLLQDWITLYGPARDPIVQTELSWLDLSGFTDLVFYTSISHIAGASEVRLQSGMSKGNSELFFELATLNSVSPRLVSKVKFDTGTDVHTRWVRWTALGDDPWEITFRVWVTAVSTG